MEILAGPKGTHLCQLNSIKALFPPLPVEINNEPQAVLSSGDIKVKADRTSRISHPMTEMETKKQLQFSNNQGKQWVWWQPTREGPDSR